MHPVDIGIFFCYMLAMLAVGFYYLKSNKSNDDYYVAGRSLNKYHIGLSVVATDVGGGFSIGLGGLGFAMGISGSWMLFTGLLGAWLSAVFVIPRLYKRMGDKKLSTFPEVFGLFYKKPVVLVATLIGVIGYIGFTSSQLLAGAKLASATFDGLDLKTALVLMGLVAVIYTAIGGLKAVIYTDTIQWIILMVGLLFIGIPIAYFHVGGISVITEALPSSFFSLSAISWSQALNWAITIIPIWFVGMTLYQRIYAAKNQKEAVKAWFIAGLLEWPIMAFMGITLGLLARVAMVQGLFADLGFSTLEGFDREMGLPLLLRTTLPIGLLGIMMSAYFSAIMSTADSCLMAASSSVVNDLVKPRVKLTEKQELRLSQWVTMAIGTGALVIAFGLTDVLKLMLLSYSFMVTGLLIPVLAGFIFERPSSEGALMAMIVGGGSTVLLKVNEIFLVETLDANFIGLAAATLVYGSFHFYKTKYS